MESASYEESSEKKLLQSQEWNVAFESEKGAEELGVDSELDVENESFVVDDVYKLNISVFVTETETPETADAFDDAMLEMEGKKSFHCHVCSKVCKSKGGLTRHYNSKHAGDSSAKGHDENITMLSLDQSIVDGFVETIKTRIIEEDLYGEEINLALKKVTSTPKLYQALSPLYQTFCKKKNQDDLLKVFYGLVPRSCELLNCNDFRIANLIMIQLPDFLVGHYNTEIQRQRHGESSTGVTHDESTPLNPVERGPLAYIGGYIISKLTHVNRKKKDNINEQIQVLLQSMKSVGPANSFIANRTRGGLTSPCDDLINILEVTELAFRDEIKKSVGMIRNIPTDSIYNATAENPKVKSLWENIVLSCSIEISSATQKLCLENVLKLYLKVRSFSYAKDYISKYRINEKRGKNKALRNELKRKDSDKL